MKKLLHGDKVDIIHKDVSEVKVAQDQNEVQENWRMKGNRKNE